MADNFFFAEGDKKNYSAKKKNYSPTNEVTHPTETPLYLWYDVFMPPPPLFGSKSKKNMGVLHKNYEKNYHDKKIIITSFFLVIPFIIF